MKMLWEKLEKFGIVVQMANSSFQFSWQGDRFLMLVFMDQGVSPAAAATNNFPVRCPPLFQPED
jgi:hypothetical protein